MYARNVLSAWAHLALEKIQWRELETVVPISVCIVLAEVHGLARDACEAMS